MTGKKAFTLLEVLVVIGITGLLVSILLPALHKVRGEGKRIYCMNNLRQMGVAAQAYTHNYDGFYPIAQYTTATAERKVGHCWDFSVEQDRVGGGKEVTAGILWDGGTVEEVHQCPSLEGPANSSDTPYSGYNYNTSYIGHGAGEEVSAEYVGRVEVCQVEIFEGVSVDIEIVMPVKATMVGRPGECALFGDGGYNGGANKFMRSPWSWAGDTNIGRRAAGAQSYRHLKMTNVCWADGHATSERARFVNSSESVVESIEGFNKKANDKLGFLSRNNHAYDLK